MKRAALLGLMLLLAAVVDCGHDSSNWDTQSACAFVASTICESSANCAVESGQITATDHAASVATCLTTEQQTLCTNISITTGNPNECESQVARISCTEYVAGALTLPASCTTLFQ